MPEPVAGAATTAASTDTSIQTPAAPAATTPAAVAPPAPAPGEPAWLPERIAQAQRSRDAELLKTLGVESLEAAKASIEAAKKAAEAAKTEAQRQAELAAAHEVLKTQNAALLGTVKERAAAELTRLPEAQRLTVAKLAGDDPSKVLSTIDALRDSGMLTATAAPTAGTVAPPTPKPPVPAGANTSAAAGAPPESPTSPPNHYAVWQELNSKNPVAAAEYLNANQAAVSAARPK